MPILSTTNNSIPLQKIANFMRTYPELTPILGVGGYSQEPILTLANDVIQKIFAQGMNWKFNRAYVPPFLTVALQQDYLTQVTNLGWMESCYRVDINNNVNNGNRAAKPVYPVEVGRDLIPVAGAGTPVGISWLPNSLARLGTWQPLTAYGCGYGQAQTPNTPIQQFMDVNGNLLYIDSTVLGIDDTSPGYNGTPITLPANSPYGTSGSTQPELDPLSPAGTTVQDGSVIWTVADPNGFAMRLSPLPAQSAICWLIHPVIQNVPPVFNTLQDVIAPLPNDMSYLFRDGLRALLYDHAGSPKALASYQKWEETLMTALRASDREADEAIFYPSNGLMSGPGGGYINLGPANPYGYGW